MEFVPNASTGFLGIFRDPDSLKAVEYYVKFPAFTEDHHVYIVDPMLATGHSMNYAIEVVKKHGAKNITVMSLISAPEGIKVVNDAHPEIDIYTASLDEKLNDKAYIIPGLGDAGDRLYRTK
jgi:uracil phosphoribosyltransferase